MELLRIRHSYNLGDAISILPGLRHHYLATGGSKVVFMQRLNFAGLYYEGSVHVTKDEQGRGVCMNKQLWEMLKPLLIAQEYIHSCEEWEGQTFDLDFDLSRDRKFIPMPNGCIYHWPWFVHPQLACDLSQQWITIGPELTFNFRLTMGRYILINRTERYTNPYITYYFLKNSPLPLYFIGTDSEYEIFRTQWKLENKISRVVVNDFHQLAAIIHQAELFIGNQSFAFHIANALKVPRLLEFCAGFPNTFPVGANGYTYLYDEVLQYYFNKLTS